ncbi:MAG TPA: type IV secretion system protein VirB10 [Brevundimonas sp.]|nr:type IV secretion system protein VirB10 [Brevundimonas sp.]
MTDHKPEPSERPDAAPETQAGRDRGISPIAGRFGGRNSRLITLGALVAGCGVFLFATWDRGDAKPREGRERDEPARQVVPFEPARRAAEPPLLSDTNPDAPTLVTEPEVPDLQAGAPQPARGPTAAEQRQALQESARRAPVLAYSRPGGPSRPSPTAADALLPVSVQDPGQSGPLDALRRSSPIGEVAAGRLPDRNLLLAAGANLPCVLQTAMDTATPGFVSCVLPSDVYSESGAVVLMERGTRVLGEYQSGLQQGRRRLFVLWTRAVTPQGVSIVLASPASDALGRAGFDGQVDTHFWDRFGGALLLSLVDDGLYAAVGQDDALRNSARVPSDAAGIALQSSVAIPPTLRKSQGAEVSIFVAQDLNFASVYRLRAR